METVRLEEFGKDFGLVHEVIVTGRKVGAGREFWSRLAHDEGLFRGIADAVLGRVGLTEAEQLALEILGPSKVLGYRDVCRVWQADLPAEPILQFTEEILREYAEANAAGLANWRLVYISGFDLRTQREKMDWNRKKQPCFDSDCTWWLESRQDTWAKTPIEPGYRLLDFTKRFSSIHWDTQNKEIAQLGDQFERAEEQAVAEACFSNFLLNKGERLLPDWYHWGRLRTAFGLHVFVGRFDQSGFRVNDWDDYPNGGLGVVVSRKSARALLP